MTTLTRTDKIINKIKNNPKLSIFFVIATIFSVISPIVQLPHNLISIIKESTISYEIQESDLDRESNQRFGFSFLYPKTWDRQDPQNGDGNKYVYPLNREITFTAWGGYLLDEELYYGEDLGYKLETLSVKFINDDPNIKVLENVLHGLHISNSRKMNDGNVETEIQQYPGRRIKSEQKINGKTMIDLSVYTAYGMTHMETRCTVPKNLFSEFENMCMKLVSSLRILGKDSAPFARENDE